MAKEQQASTAPKGVETQLPDTKNWKEGFDTIETERYMFNPNKGCKGPLIGYLLNLVPMAPIRRGKEVQEWECFLVKTTFPAEVLDREGKVHKIPAGKEVLTPATYNLVNHLSRASSHPTHVFEIFIDPVSKVDIGHGQTMWRYDLGYKKTSLKLRSEFGVAALLGNPEMAQSHNQLPAKGQETAETAGEASEDIPF